MIESQSENRCLRPELTPRMYDILDAVMDGAYTLDDIARVLEIKVTTLKVELCSYQGKGGLYRRLRAPNLTGSLVEALKWGLIDPPCPKQDLPEPE